MKLAIVFEPDPSLGFDPADPRKEPRKLGEFIDAEKTDTIIVWREYREDAEGGVLTHVIGSGIWENIDADAMAGALAYVSDLPEDE